MADSAMLRFINRGIRFSTTKGAATYVGLKTASDPATSFYLNLPATLPGSTQALTVDPSGNIGYQSLGGGGSVTSVGLAAPPMFTVSGSPITASGTLTLSLSSQAANTLLAAPDGAAGVPSFRAMVAADVPSLTAAKISNFDTQVRTSRLDQMAAPAANVAMNNFSLTGLATPAAAQDAATKAYVDAVAEGNSNKGTARAASVADVNLAAPGAGIDGVTLANGELVLIKNQASASQNGLYVFNGAAVPMTRAANADTSAEVKTGLFVFVSEGSTNANNGYTLTTPAPITLGTTGLTFTQTTGAGQITAGAGLTKTGNQLDVVGTANRVTVAADSIDIASNYAGQSSISTLGTVTTGVWQGSAVAVASGGTGGTSAASARSNLAAAGIDKQTFTNASLTSGILTVTHTLGQQYGQVTLIDENGKQIYTADDVTFNSPTQYTVDLTSFGTITGTWRTILVA